MMNHSVQKTSGGQTEANDLPLVSILINNYNYGQYLKQAIDSALNQTYKNIEVIVVDDGSQDHSKDVIQEFPEATITAIFKPNGGQASAFNAGFAAASGDIICFLDADDYFYPDKVATIVDLFQSQPAIGWIFHTLHYVDAEAKSLQTDDPSQSIKQSEIVDFRETFAQGRRFTHAVPCGLCFRREILSKILPMPESSGVTISDNYLKYAALALSPGLFLAENLAVQRIHTSNTYTFRQNYQLRAEINVKTGYYLRQNFPHIRLFADKIFTRGCGEMLAEASPKALWQLPEFRAYLRHYAPLTFWGKYAIKTPLHMLRFKLSNRRSTTQPVVQRQSL